MLVLTLILNKIKKTNNNNDNKNFFLSFCFKKKNVLIKIQV